MLPGPAYFLHLVDIRWRAAVTPLEFFLARKSGILPVGESATTNPAFCHLVARRRLLCCGLRNFFHLVARRRSLQLIGEGHCEVLLGRGQVVVLLKGKPACSCAMSVDCRGIGTHLCTHMVRVNGRVPAECGACGIANRIPPRRKIGTVRGEGGAGGGLTIVRYCLQRTSYQ